MRYWPLAAVLFLGCVAPRPPGTASPLLNPTLLPIEGSEDLKELRTFKHKVSAASDRLIAEKKATHISIYFRDLWNGPQFGLSGNEPFTAGSLLKLPILIAVLKQAEGDPELLMRTVVVSHEGPAAAQPAYFRSRKTLVDGQSYTVDELLRYMISYSDNRALAPLIGVLDKTELDSTYFDLGLLIPMIRSANFQVTVQEYASLYRILYNAAYLNRDMSARALGYLDDTDFDEGLAGPVPKSVTVAHKFGEAYKLETDVTQLHDCGIVYHPRRPYLLCLMTRGRDVGKLVMATRDVSSLVWAEVDKQSAGP